MERYHLLVGRLQPCSRLAQVDGCPHTKVARNIELFSEASDGSQVTEVGKELHFVGCTSCYETWGRMATAIPHSPRLGQVNYSNKEGIYPHKFMLWSESKSTDNPMAEGKRKLRLYKRRHEHKKAS